MAQIRSGKELSANCMMSSSLSNTGATNSVDLECWLQFIYAQRLTTAQRFSNTEQSIALTSSKLDFLFYYIYTVTFFFYP